MIILRFIRGFFRGIWSLLSAISRAVTVLLPLLFIGILITAFFVGRNGAALEPLPPKAALLLNPAGVLVENRTPLEPLEAFLGSGQGEVLLPHLIKVIEAAADDDRISALVLDLQQLAGPSVSQTRELLGALERFKATDKPVVSVGDYFDQSHYLLASQANRVIMHPEGAINLHGFGVYRSYLRQVLANVMVTMNVFRVGENKSAVEPFLRDNMSDSERKVVARWLGELWTQYTALVERGRSLEPGFVDRFIEELPDRLEIAGGDFGQLMLDAGFVDELLDHTEQDALLAEIVGATDDDGQYEAVDFNRYLMAIAETDSGDLATVAVVPIEGELIPGESGKGFAGADTVVEQLERAVEADNVKALVLRINSPGGSVFASEVIRRKVLDIKATGLPVVVSMGSLAASGGYYIAADADEIWAQPSTLTGSIGVFAAFPTVERLYDWAGVTVDGVGTTGLSNAVRFDTGVNESGRRVINSVIANIYEDFVELVAQGRGMTWDQVNQIAGGTVWSGVDAQDIGLVDELGDLAGAVEAAATLAGIDEWRTRRVGTPVTPEQLMLEELGRKFGRVYLPGDSVLTDLLGQLAQPLRVIDSLQDPRNMYVRCLECSAGI